MIKKLLSVIIPNANPVSQRAEIERELIRKEARTGGKLFGPVAKGGRREFFCLDEHTWVWHEEWVDQNGKRQILTTRYDVRPHGVLKAQDNQPYQPLSREEATRFYQAVKKYCQNVFEQYNAMLAA